MKQLKRAKEIKRNLGVTACRGYMRNRDWSLAAKLYVLILC